MAVNILLKRSSIANKRPTDAQAPEGSLVLNFDTSTGGLYYQDSGTGIIKVGPAQVSATAPNATPAGSTGNSLGEFWYDTSTSTLKIWTGAAWATAGSSGSGTVTSVTGTSPIVVNNATPSTPIIGINPASTTTAGAVQLNDTTSSTSTTEAATANAVKSAYDLAHAALPKAGGTMTGAITFAAGQTFPILGIQDATTVQKGVVQLNDTVASTSVTEALTANQGKALQDQISALTTSSNLALAGTFDAGTSQILTVTAAGTAQSFVVGNNLPAAAAGNTDYFVIVTAGGSYSPPGGGGPYTVSQGDWLLSTGTAWQFLNVGADLPVATTGAAGIVQLATTLETQTGTNTTKAITPSAAAGTYLSLTTLTAKGSLITATATSTPANLTVGTNGQFLMACSTPTTGLCWADLPSATPTVAGVVIGCTVSGNNTSLGFTSNPNRGTGNTAVGSCSMCCAAAGAVGNTAVGNASLNLLQTGFSNTGVGSGALCSLTAGASYNTALGEGSGALQTAGSCNLTLGVGVNAASLTGSCQLAIGFGSTRWLTGCSTGAIRPGAGVIDCAGCCGVAGQFMKSTGSAILWSNLPAATTGTFDDVATTGIVYGCTTNDSTALGISAARAAYSVGSSSACNLAIGVAAMANIGLGGCNTVVGNSTLGLATRGCLNTVVGYYSVGFSLEGDCNVVLGSYAGNGMRCASNNVVIGHYVSPALSCGSCQLAIGYDFGCCWLTGDCNKHIKPGAGIRDCAGCLGTSGQVLSSTGTALQWVAGGGGIPCSCITGKGAIVTGNAANSPVALPAGSNSQILRANSNCSVGVEWSRIGSYALGFCNAGTYLTVDDFSFGVWGGTNKSLVFTNVSGSTKYVGWSSFAMNAIVNSCSTCGCNSFTSTAGAAKYFYENLDLTSSNSCQTALFSVYAAPVPSAGPALCIYCITGIIGDGYTNNFICVARVY